MKNTNITTAIQVIDRMANILDAISEYEDAVSLKFISADTGLHTSTTYRILSSLTKHGFVTRNNSGKYQLGHKLMALGCRVNAEYDIRNEAIEIMEDLKNEVNETVNLIIREGDEVVYIERSMPLRMMRVEQVIGSRAPMHVTAVGKLMLAKGGRKEIEAYADRSGLAKFTPNTLTNLKELKTELQSDLLQNYALDNEEAELGVGCIGTLIYDSTGQVVAGLSISAPISRREDEWVDKLISSAELISLKLGYRSSE